MPAESVRPEIVSDRTLRGEMEGGWTKVIKPRKPLLSLNLGEIWEYRGLVYTYAVRDLRTSYKQTVLGPLWFLVQPLVITAVFSYLFGRMARFGSDDIPHYLFYMGGLVPWGYFSESLLKTSNVFVEYQHVFSKVYFPRLCVPLATMLGALFPMSIQFVLFLAGLIVYLVKGEPSVQPNWLILLTPLVFVQLGALSLGLGCMVSALSRRFRDMAMGIRVGLQLLMFGSAIVFPLTHLSAEGRSLLLLNPVVPPIEFFRLAFMGKSLVEPWHLAVSTIISFSVLLIGTLLFHRAEQTAMDTV